jgi:putative membrane-bound dehydrogenase-like protein
MTHIRVSFPLLILFLGLLSSCTNVKKQAVPQGFQVEPGFTLTLVASEPLIKDPVDLEFDENGDALVLEMPGYPFEDTQSRIILLKDENEDGLYDNQIVFAENLQLASSIMPYKKGVLVAAPPYLLFVKDSDGDFKADVYDTLMSGFATGNLQHNFNGLTYGVDNWIYAVNGGNSGKPYWWGDTTSRIDLRGQDLRFNLETRQMEKIGRSSGGFSLGMDAWGRLFETHNTDHISHLVFPGRYQGNVTLLNPHTLSIISDHEENGLARIYPIGEQESRVNHPEQSGYFSGSCGITWYGSGALGEEYENTVWVADVVLNLLHVDKLKPNGASFSASRMLDKRDFLASTDRSFRPVNLTTGPDGLLYVVDMHRQVIEHPEWIPDEIEEKLNLDKGKDKGRIYKIQKLNADVAHFQVEQWKSTESIIASLRNPNQWVRRTAQRLLMEGSLRAEEINKLKEELASSLPTVRLPVLWILFGKNQLTVEELISALNDASPEIRENALMMTERDINSNETLFRKALSLASDKDQRVRLQAALTLSTINSEKFNKYQKDIMNQLAQSALQDMDDWNIAGITLAAQRVPEDLFKQLASSKDNLANVKLLSSLAGISGNTVQQVAAVVGSLAASPLSSTNKQLIVDQLSKSIHAPLKGNVLSATLQQLEKGSDIELVASIASLRKKLSLPPSSEFITFSKHAIKTLENRSLPDSVRYKQLSLIALLPYENKSEVLFRCLDNTQPLKIQEAALKQLADASAPSVGQMLVDRWVELGPQVRRGASDILLYKEMYHEALLTGLEKGVINIGEMNFDLERRRQLLWWTDSEETKRRASALFSDAGVTTRREAIAKMSEALTLKGSQANGANVFQTMCSTCHIYGSKGQEVGPVLTEINRKSKESLMHDILDPNAAVDTKYINHRLATKSGDVHIGIVDNETDQFVTIKKMGGEKVTVYKTEITSFTSMGTSLMMEGLENNMTTQDMADLLAYLQTGN